MGDKVAMISPLSPPLPHSPLPKIFMQVDKVTFSWFQVPEDIKNLLILAAQNWENNSESSKYINQALQKAGKNTDVFIAAYRYFYYKNNYSLALEMAIAVMDKVKTSQNLPENWFHLKPILIHRKHDSEIRLYLKAFAASALIFAKVGELDKAKEISTKVKEVDDNNEFGAKILLDILTSSREDE